MRDYTIITPLHLPWDRPADFQRQTCLKLAKFNKVIVYMHHDGEFFLKALLNGKIYPQEDKNITFHQPKYILPFRRFPLIRSFNNFVSYICLYLSVFIQNLLVNKRVIIWIFDPVFHYIAQYSKFAISIYDCMDDVMWGKHNDNQEQINEIKLIKSVKYFFVISLPLFYLKKKIRTPNLVLEQCFSHTEFENTSIMPVTTSKIVGYIGDISERIDWKLVCRVITLLPQYQFHFYGPLSTSSKENNQRVEKITNILSRMPNVKFFIRKYTKRDIARIICHFRIGIIPYDYLIRASRFSYPLKALEYLYFGKPVLSTRIPALYKYKNNIHFSNEANNWVKYISGIMNSNLDDQQSDDIRRIVLNKTWENKIELISNHIMSRLKLL